MIMRVHREPDRATPIGVASEHAGVRFRGQVVHAVFLSAGLHDVRVFLRETSKASEYREG